MKKMTYKYKGKEIEYSDAYNIIGGYDCYSDIEDNIKEKEFYFLSADYKFEAYTLEDINRVAPKAIKDTIEEINNNKYYKLNPYDPFPYLMKGLLFDKLDMPDRAEECFNEAFRLNPEILSSIEKLK